jgi:type II secretory pathway pseudopilin PulG
MAAVRSGPTVSPFFSIVAMPHPPFSLSARRAFSIIEIAVILIIIGLMLVIIVPPFFSAMSERKAQRVKSDLVTLSNAIEHYALDNGKTGGAPVNYADLRKYLDPKTDAYRREGHDVYGDSYGPFKVGTRPSVPPKAADRLSDVAGADFWSPFQ